MSESVSRDDLDSFSDGMRAGIWRVPVDGFAWRDDPAPLTRRRLADGEAAQGPWLVPTGAKTTLYALLRKAGLLDAFDHLGQDATERAILRFADRYGWLFDPRPEPRPDLARPTHMEADSYQRWAREAGKLATLRWLWRQAERDDADTLAPFVLAGPKAGTRVIRLAAVGGTGQAELTRRQWTPERLFEAVTEGMSQAMERDIDRVFLETVGRARRADDYCAAFPVGSVPQRGHASPVAVVRQFVRMMVNNALRGHVHLQLMHPGDGELRSVPDSLLAAVYLKFSLEMAGGKATQRDCARPDCSTIFVPKRRDQLYCSKRCAALVRYHRAKSRSR